MKIFLILLILNSSFLIFNCFAQQYGWVVLNPASIPPSTDLSDLYFTSHDTGWISSGSTNNIFKTTDGGLTFTTQNTTITTNAIHMVSATEGYCGGADGFVYRTADGGANWNFNGTIASTLIDMTFPPSGGTGYACGFDGVIYSVTSTGVTAMTSGVNGNLSSVAFPVNSSEGWFCGVGSIIRHYTGNNWVGDQINITGSWNAIYFVDNHNGWAVGDDGKTIHTTDGQTWSVQRPSGSGSSLFDVFFLNSNEGWAVGINGTILHTTNGGTNWNVEASGLSAAFLTGVHFTSSTNGYVVGQSKTLLKYTQITSVEDEKEKPTEFKLEQNYPNPFNPNTSIQYAIASRQFVQLKVYDVLGNEIATLVNEEKAPGGYEVEFKPESRIQYPASGIYFYQLKASDFVQTKKMAIIK
jgi:photosystem II stability/assembly factor-like uncharacterized protein